jgi:hypothetical protein
MTQCVGLTDTKITSMPSTTNLPKGAAPIAKSKRADIQCDFKPKSSQRKIRFASDDEARIADKWAVEKYHETFKALAK